PRVPADLREHPGTDLPAHRHHRVACVLDRLGRYRRWRPRCGPPGVCSCPGPGRRGPGRQRRITGKVKGMTMTLPRTLGRTPTAPGLDRAPAHRNQSRVAMGAFLIVAFSLAFAVSFSRAGDRQAVLAVARPVAAGQVITAADVTEVRISADPGLHPVPASDRSRIVGRTAGVALTPGTLVTPAQVASGPSVPAGQAVVGAALKPGQFPPD